MEQGAEHSYRDSSLQDPVPEIAKELKSRLVQEAKEGIIKMCCRKMFDWLKVLPFQADQQLEEDEDDYLDGQGHVGLRIMGLAFTSEMDNAAFCVLIDGDGEVVDFLQLLPTRPRAEAD